MLLCTTARWILLGAALLAALPTPAFGWVEGANVKINTDNTTQLQNEEACVINPLNSNNVVAVWRDFRLGFRRVGVGTTFDGGTTWSDSLLGVPPYDRHSDPIMTYDADGDLIICVLAYPNAGVGSGLFTWRSSDGGLTWSDPITAVDEQGPFEDKQWINVDRTGGIYNNRIYLPWTRFTSTSQIYLVHTTLPDNFGAPVPVSDGTGVQWPTVTIAPDGTVLVSWVNFAQARLMLDRSTDGGDTWGVDKVITQLSAIPGTINGGILVFPYPAMECDISGGPFNGRTYLLYSGFAADGELDLYLLRSDDKGDTWSPEVRLNDDPVGNNVDQFHPWITIDETGILTANWYDRRLDPNNYLFDMYLAHSFDGGSTWTANRRLSDVSSSPADAKQFDDGFYQNWHGSNDAPDELFDPDKDPRAGLIGEYTGLSTHDGVAHVVFTDTRNGHQDAYSVRVTIGFMPPPLAAPSSGLISTNSTPTFSWKKSGATPAEIAGFPGTKVQPLRYRIQVDNDSTFASIDYQQSGLVGTSHQFSAPLADGRWFWRVDAVNDSGRTTGFDEGYRVLWIDTQPPAQPTLIEPINEDTVSYAAQSFSWSVVDKEPQGTPVRYDLQVATDVGFTGIVKAVSNIAATSYENATPLPDGVQLFWRVRAIDLAGNTLGFSSPESFVTNVAFVCGDADGNGAISIADAVYLINYIFSGGPAPAPILSGDADCTGALSIADAVYLINYIFSGGTSPCTACP